MSIIHHTFGPHIDRAFLAKTCLLSFAPWYYKRGDATRTLQHALKDHFSLHATLFASGRESLLALLQALTLPPDSDVILQGYTCVVLPNAIHAAGLRPVYADIDPDTLNLTVETVDAVRTSQSKVLLCQHTFGIPGPSEALRTYCDQHDIFLIEECVHSIPDKNTPSAVGKMGDAVLLSFGRDKAISGIAGGAVLVRNPALAAKIRIIEASSSTVPFWEITQLLEYPARMSLIVRPLHRWKLDRPLLALLRFCRLFIPILGEEEINGRMRTAVRRMPNVCAALTLWQLSKLATINDHRRMLTAYYARESAKRGWPILASIRALTPPLPLQKFPLFVDDARSIRRRLERAGIYLDDGWTACVICPEWIDREATEYRPGSDPCAEAAAQSILSLPTHPTMTLHQAERLVQTLAPLLR